MTSSGYIEFLATNYIHAKIQVGRAEIALPLMASLQCRGAKRRSIKRKSTSKKESPCDMKTRNAAAL